MAVINQLPHAGGGIDDYIVKAFYPSRTSTTVTVQYGKTFAQTPTIDRLEFWNGTATESTNVFTDGYVSSVSIGLSSVTITKAGATYYNDWGGLLVMKADQ